MANYIQLTAPDNSPVVLNSDAVRRVQPASGGCNIDGMYYTNTFEEVCGLLGVTITPFMAGQPHEARAPEAKAHPPSVHEAKAHEVKAHEAKGPAAGHTEVAHAEATHATKGHATKGHSER